LSGIVLLLVLPARLGPTKATRRLTWRRAQR